MFSPLTASRFAAPRPPTPMQARLSFSLGEAPAARKPRPATKAPVKAMRLQHFTACAGHWTQPARMDSSVRKPRQAMVDFHFR